MTKKEITELQEENKNLLRDLESFRRVCADKQKRTPFDT